MRRREPNTDATIRNAKAALEWIQKNRRDPDGDALSMRRIVELAGLHPSHADQINNLRIKTIDVATVRKIAVRWDVKISWILTGKPPIEPYDETAGEDRYPSRAPTLVWARRVGYSDAVIATVARMRLADGMPDPGGPYWSQQLEIEVRHAAIAPHAATPSEPARPTTAPRDWKHFWRAADGILLDNPRENRDYYGSVIGFSKTLTTESPPKELTTEWLWPRVRAFSVQHENNPAMSEWHDEGALYHDQHKPTRPGSKRPTTDKPVEKRNQR